MIDPEALRERLADRAFCREKVGTHKLWFEEPFRAALLVGARETERCLNGVAGLVVEEPLGLAGHCRENRAAQ